MGDRDRLAVGIIGELGYSTVQLVCLLSLHPKVEIAYLASDRGVGSTFNDFYPHLNQQVTIPIEAIDLEKLSDRAQVSFFALPNGQSSQYVPVLLERGQAVIDLSADYRFRDLAIYSSWYRQERFDQSTALRSVYGLPELYRDAIKNARLIACPGCYPTASLLALAPLIKQGLILPETAIIDAKSGTSGDGRRPETTLLFSEVANSLNPYNIAKHRHTPEIEQICSELAGYEIRVQFTPHQVPIVRGILATVYATLRDPGLVREDLITIFSAFYRSSPFVKILPNGIYPHTKWASGTNLCYLGIETDPRTDRAIVISAIDNLLKGQAGQGVQCLNLSQGWDETLGLSQMNFYP
jgi:N-acetyl-gamma-glutamyl-phosphate reductase